MPELPEVETTRRGIAPLIVNQAVVRVRVHNMALRWPVSTELGTQLAGQQIMRVSRRSKYLLIACSRGTLLVHLGMTGHLRCAPTRTARRRKHDHVEIQLSGGTTLIYNDSRRFGAILWTSGDPLQHPLLVKLGPEPFSAAFSTDYLYALSRGRRVAVKPFLMNAQVVVGVGNIYANEALFRAGVSPKRCAGQIGRAAYGRLVDAVVEVLEEAIEAGGTTIRDFAASDGKPGYFVQELRVYGRAEQPCVNCHEPIRHTRLGQRSTYYCPVCQK
jgi:formamidopyrimidine-DNA glycosylase